MLQTNDNIYIAGVDINNSKERDQLIEAVKPVIVCIDKPQDWQRYVDQLRSGEKLEQITKQIKGDFPTLNQSIWTQDIAPLIETCKKVYVRELYFIDVPSYLTQTIPLFLEDNLAPAEQSIRDGLMSLRAKEIKIKSPKDKKIFMILGDLLQLKVYRMLELIQHYDAHLVQEDKKKLYTVLDGILEKMKDEPLLYKEGSILDIILDLVPNPVESDYQKIRKAIETRQIPAEKLEQTLSEAKSLTDRLDISTFKGFKSLNIDYELLRKLKQQLDQNRVSKRLKEDFLLEIK